MIKFRLFAVFIGLLLILNMASNAQTYNIAGYITDSSSGETLIGATIVSQQNNKGTVTNSYGFYNIFLNKGKNTLVYSYVGYTPKTIEIYVQSDTTLNIPLSSEQNISEITVTANSITNRLKETQMSKETLSPKMIQSMPALLGETDVIKTIQLLPGVQSGTEGSSGLYVRGGAPDENLIMLDDVTIYNVNHLFGFFSVFNTDAIKSVTLHKGGFPARFGGRLSSILDIHMNDGNDKEFHGGASIGLVSSKINFEGPLAKERASFQISARRTYFDIFTRIAATDDQKGNYAFWDINAKVNYKVSDRNRIFFSIYSGRDAFDSEYKDSWENFKSHDKNGLGWGNVSAAVRWNSMLRNNLFMNTTAAYTYYDFDVSSENQEYENNELQEDVNYKYISLIRDWSLKTTFDYSPMDNHDIKFGAKIIHHTFDPGAENYRANYNDEPETQPAEVKYTNHCKKPTEFYAFIEDDAKLLPFLNANIGLHASLFHVDGVTYKSVEPRISMASILPNVTIKAAYSQMQQYLHLLSNGTIGLPTDLWVPVTGKIKPMKSQQVAVGAVTSLFTDFLFSIEGYYKDMRNILEYKDGASFFGSQTQWEDKVDVGKGRSYGLEFLIKKDIGNTTGWIGYTLSKTERQIDSVNKGNWYPASYDRTHDVSIVLNHKFSKRFDMGATWIYGTGYAYTLATHYINTSMGIVNYVSGRNNYRLPDYHRLDVGLNIHKYGKKAHRILTLSVYNVYNHHNPFFVYFGHNDNGETCLKQLSIFTIIPSISYSIKF